MRRLMSLMWSVLLAASLVPVTATAANATLSGRVYNGATGAAYGGVVITLCNGQTATTNGSGNWAVVVPVGTGYCARVAGGAPAGLGAPATRNNPEVGAQPSYENQLAGRNCYHDASCGATYAAWDRIYDTGLDFAYGITPATPAPTPVAAAPTPAAPAPSPTPAVTVPTVPQQFSAKPTKDIHDFRLTWQATDGATSYQLDRSVDNTTWQTIGPALVATTYDDHGVRPGTHYYYRLRAVNTAGASDNATADLSSPEVSAAPAAAVMSSAAPRAAEAAAAPNDTWINYAVVGGGVVLALLIIGLLPIRRRRRQSYLEYLRSKYYNL